MTDIDLPDPDHVVRYVRPRLVLDDGSVDGSAFRLRSGDSGVSVNWLECFDGLSKSEQIEQVRILSRLKMRRNGRLAELNVGMTRQSTGSLASFGSFMFPGLLNKATKRTHPIVRLPDYHPTPQWLRGSAT